MVKKRDLSHDLARMKPSPDIIIIGTGPVGSWIGHELRMAGHEIGFVDRGQTARDRRWTVERDGIVHEWAAPVDPRLSQVSKVIFVTTRAHHLNEVWNEHLLRLPELPGRTVIVCCNGDVERILEAWQSARPDMTFEFGVVTAGIAEKSQHNFVRGDRDGKLFYGQILKAHSHQGHEKTPIFSPEFIYDHEIRERARKKWLFNTAANTLAGALQLPRNDLMIHAHRNLLRELFDEAYDLACERWDIWRKDDRRNPGHREVLWLELCQLITDTGANENSMSRAMRLGTGTNEAKFLGGVAFGHTGYPEIKRMTRLLLKDGPSFLA